MSKERPQAMTFEEIARVLHITAYDAASLFESAMFKIRENTAPELRTHVLRYLRELDSLYQQGSF